MSRAPGMYIDQTEFPLLLVEQVGECTDAQVATYLQALGSIRRFSRYAVLLDVRAGVPFNSKQRKMQSDWMVANQEQMQRCLGIAFVEASLLMRGAMQAAFWLNPPQYAYLVTKSLDEGRLWVTELLSKHGLAIAA